MDTNEKKVIISISGEQIEVTPTNIATLLKLKGSVIAQLATIRRREFTKEDWIKINDAIIANLNVGRASDMQIKTNMYGMMGMTMEAMEDSMHADPESDSYRTLHASEPPPIHNRAVQVVRNLVENNLDVDGDVFNSHFITPLISEGMPLLDEMLLQLRLNSLKHLQPLDIVPSSDKPETAKLHFGVPIEGKPTVAFNFPDATKIKLKTASVEHILQKGGHEMVPMIVSCLPAFSEEDQDTIRKELDKWFVTLLQSRAMVTRTDVDSVILSDYGLEVMSVLRKVPGFREDGALHGGSYFSVSTPNTERGDVGQKFYKMKPEYKFEVYPTEPGLRATDVIKGVQLRQSLIMVDSIPAHTPLWDAMLSNAGFTPSPQRQEMFKNYIARDLHSVSSFVIDKHGNIVREEKAQGDNSNYAKRLNNKRKGGRGALEVKPPVGTNSYDGWSDKNEKIRIVRSHFHGWSERIEMYQDVWSLFPSKHRKPNVTSMRKKAKHRALISTTFINQK